MADEQVMRGSAGPAKRQRRSRRELTAVARDAERPDLDERERKISPRRKPMGPLVPPERDRPGIAAEAQPALPDEPPTDPE
jgi:hypothetical protein